MAMDEAIAQAVGAGQVPPTLRFFDWCRSTLSFGCLQRTQETADLAACARLGVTVVRRPTGGRAVLHDRELTYSVSLPLRGDWGRLSVAESFRLVGEGLVTGLRLLGLAATLGESGGALSKAERAVACFQMRRMPAILVGGRKLVGSAQRRWNTALLQHGSLLLELDRDLHRAVFPAWPGQGADAGVVWLATLLGETPVRSTVETALRAGWSKALGVELVPGGVTLGERQEAERLVRVRYGQPAWTWRC